MDPIVTLGLLFSLLVAGMPARLLAVDCSESQTLVWEGSEGPSGSRWDKAFNWRPECYPSPEDHIVIDENAGTIYVPGSPRVKTLTVSSTVELSGDGGGLHVLEDGGNSGTLKLTLQGGLQIEGTFLNQGLLQVHSGLTVYDNATLTNSGDVRWWNGAWTRYGDDDPAAEPEVVNASDGTIRLRGDLEKDWSGGLAVHNEGAIIFDSDGNLDMEPGSRLLNQRFGVVNFLTNANIEHSGDPAPIHNWGTFRKEGGGGWTVIKSEFYNRSDPATGEGGVVVTLSGRVRLVDTTVEHQVGATITGNAKIDPPTLGPDHNNGIYAPGVSVGTLTFLGDYRPSNQSVLEIEIAPGGNDLLAVSGGTGTFNGTLEVLFVDGYPGPQLGDVFTIATCQPLCDVNSGFDAIVSPSGSHFEATVLPDKVQIEAVCPPDETTPPQIELIGPTSLALECGLESYVEPGATVTDLCDPDPQLEISGTVDSGSPGRYTVVYTATDSNGNSAVATRRVTVSDTQAPRIRQTVLEEIWPVDRRLEPVRPGQIVTVEDACDGAPTWRQPVFITSATSDEPIYESPINPRTKPDIVVTRDCETALLRATHIANGNGRVYVLWLETRDASGNVGTGPFRVHVPTRPGTPPVYEDPVAEVSGCTVDVTNR